MLRFEDSLECMSPILTKIMHSQVILPDDPKECLKYYHICKLGTRLLRKCVPNHVMAELIDIRDYTIHSETVSPTQEVDEYTLSTELPADEQACLDNGAGGHIFKDDRFVEEWEQTHRYGELEEFTESRELCQP